VPGVAFDKNGYRLGYGKGFYDRFLAEKKTVAVGLGYSFQLISSLPLGSHDKSLDAIATEDGIHYA
jgi:5-formyltetrahydrofolate cyclo-ligase